MRAAIETLGQLEVMRGAIQQIVRLGAAANKALDGAKAGTLLMPADVAYLQELDGRLQGYAAKLEALSVTLPTVEAVAPK